MVTDYEDGTILLGHDGPFHLTIADGKPVLRGLGVYHGKQGSGVSVEAKVRRGPITTLGCSQTRDGNLKFIITEAEEGSNTPNLITLDMRLNVNGVMTKNFGYRVLCINKKAALITFIGEKNKSLIKNTI